MSSGWTFLVIIGWAHPPAGRNACVLCASTLLTIEKEWPARAGSAVCDAGPMALQFTNLAAMGKYV